ISHSNMRGAIGILSMGENCVGLLSTPSSRANQRPSEGSYAENLQDETSRYDRNGDAGAVLGVVRPVRGGAVQLQVRTCNDRRRRYGRAAHAVRCCSEERECGATRYPSLSEFRSGVPDLDARAASAGFASVLEHGFLGLRL